MTEVSGECNDIERLGNLVRESGHMQNFQLCKFGKFRYPTEIGYHKGTCSSDVVASFSVLMNQNISLLECDV